MKKCKTVFLCIALGGMVLPQLSVAEGSGGVSGKVSTLGVGIEYVKPLNSHFSARFGVNGFTYDKDIDKSGVSYDGNLKLRSISAIADYHPWSNGFRLSGGALYNANKLSINAQPSNGTFEFNGVNYNAADVGSASGKIDFNSVSPYIGIGWGVYPENNTGWSFNAELGVMYHGEPDASLSVICGGALNTAQCTQLTNDVTAEQADLQNDLSDFKWYPVLSIGMTYKF